MDEFFDISTWLTAIVGAIVLLVIYRLVVDRGGHGRVRMAGGVDGDAGREVEVLDTGGGGDTATTPGCDLEVRDLEPDVGQVGHGRSVTLIGCPAGPERGRRRLAN